MRKILAGVFAAVSLFALAACSVKPVEIEIIIPAGSEEAFVYSDTEFSVMGDSIQIAAGEGLPDTEVLLNPVSVREENAYEPAYLTPGMPVEMDVERGATFKIGVSMQNETSSDKTVSVEITGVTLK